MTPVFEPGERVTQRIMCCVPPHDPFPGERHGTIRGFEPDGQAYRVQWDDADEWTDERPESLAVERRP